MKHLAFSVDKLKNSQAKITNLKTKATKQKHVLRRPEGVNKRRVPGAYSFISQDASSRRQQSGLFGLPSQAAACYSCLTTQRERHPICLV